MNIIIINSLNKQVSTGSFILYFAIFLALFLVLAAFINVTYTFKKYRKYKVRSLMKGAEVAKYILEQNNIYNVNVVKVKGKMSDHYDPTSGTIRLSDDVYDDSSISAVCIAAHEAGHAIQHATEYRHLQVRTSIVPYAMLGNYLYYPLISFGFLFAIPLLVKIGIIFFGIILVFHLATLPVEFNASHRAIDMLEYYEILDEVELKPAKEVLGAAALTYVASTFLTLLQFLRLLSKIKN